jgi:acetyltransferase-like isoleucine patch superfamily enzyme
MPPVTRSGALARRVVARLRGGDPTPEVPVAYRHGVVNKADELVAADHRATALIEAGILTMGDYSYYAPTVHVFAGDEAVVRVGKFSSIAAGAQFFVGGSHRTDWVTTYGLRAVFGLPGAYQDGTPASNGDIEVGHDCWIALDAVVLSGVTIGHGAVVATRAVVTKDVRPYAIVAGNPAREVGRRFPDDQVDALLRIAWWDWPIETVLEHVPELSSSDLDDFIARFDPARGPSDGSSTS